MMPEQASTNAASRDPVRVRKERDFVDVFPIRQVAVRNEHRENSFVSGPTGALRYFTRQLRELFFIWLASPPQALTSTVGVLVTISQTEWPPRSTLRIVKPITEQRDLNHVRTGDGIL